MLVILHHFVHTFRTLYMNNESQDSPGIGEKSVHDPGTMRRSQNKRPSDVVVLFRCIGSPTHHPSFQKGGPGVRKNGRNATLIVLNHKRTQTSTHNRNAFHRPTISTHYDHYYHAYHTKPSDPGSVRLVVCTGCPVILTENVINFLIVFLCCRNDRGSGKLWIWWRHQKYTFLLKQTWSTRLRYLLVSASPNTS